MSTFKKIMKILGNIVWIIFGGIEWAIICFVMTAFCFVTLINIPVGLQFAKLGVFVVWPFGKDVQKVKPSGFKTFLNIVWAIFFGWEFFLLFGLFGLLFCATVIGIPFGKQYFKIAKFIIMPLGKGFVKVGTNNEATKETSKKEEKVIGNSVSTQTNKVNAMKTSGVPVVTLTIKEQAQDITTRYEDELITKLRKEKELLEFGVIDQATYDERTTKIKKELLTKKDEEITALYDGVYNLAMEYKNTHKLQLAHDNFAKIEEYKDSASQAKECLELLISNNKEFEYTEFKENVSKIMAKPYSPKDEEALNDLIIKYEPYSEYKDGAELIKLYKAKYSKMKREYYVSNGTATMNSLLEAKYSDKNYQEFQDIVESLKEYENDETTKELLALNVAKFEQKKREYYISTSVATIESISSSPYSEKHLQSFKEAINILRQYEEYLDDKDYIARVLEQYTGKKYEQIEKTSKDNINQILSKKFGYLNVSSFYKSINALKDISEYKDYTEYINESVLKFESLNKTLKRKTTRIISAVASVVLVTAIAVPSTIFISMSTKHLDKKSGLVCHYDSNEKGYFIDGYGNDKCLSGIPNTKDCFFNIPSKIGSKPVVGISPRAFDGCSEINGARVYSGDVRIIGDYAFRNTGISGFQLEHNVQTIGKAILDGCKKIEWLNLSLYVHQKQVRNIGDFFSNLNDNDGAYYQCPENKHVMLPNEYGFLEYYYPSSLKSVTVHGTSSSSISKPYSIPENYFAGLEVDSIDLKNGLYMIGEAAFRYTTGFSGGFVANESLKNLEAYAFLNSDITTFDYSKVNNGYIGDYCFADCNNLTKLTIHNSVRNFSIEQIAYCPSIEEIYYKGTSMQWMYNMKLKGKDTIEIFDHKNPTLTVICDDGVITYNVEG